MSEPAVPAVAATRVAGLLLAAGAGRRYGGPKALVVGADGGTWARARATTLVAGGCSPVLVVVGADADTVVQGLDPAWTVVRADGWAEGMGASLRAGLDALASVPSAPDAVLVALVDTPGLTREVVSRLVAVAGPDALAQAAYHGTAAHPVLLGRRHWDGVRAVAVGDRGARDYLRTQQVETLECGDVGSGEDVDTPAEVPAPRVGG